MEVKVNITKKHLLILLIIFVVPFFGIANAVVPNPGHSASDIDFTGVPITLTQRLTIDLGSLNGAAGRDGLYLKSSSDNDNVVIRLNKNKLLLWDGINSNRANLEVGDVDAYNLKANNLDVGTFSVNDLSAGNLNTNSIKNLMPNKDIILQASDRILMKEPNGNTIASLKNEITTASGTFRLFGYGTTEGGELQLFIPEGGNSWNLDSRSVTGYTGSPLPIFRIFNVDPQFKNAFVAIKDANNNLHVGIGTIFERLESNPNDILTVEGDSTFKGDLDVEGDLTIGDHSTQSGVANPSISGSINFCSGASADSYDLICPNGYFVVGIHVGKLITGNCAVVKPICAKN